MFPYIKTNGGENIDSSSSPISQHGDFQAQPEVMGCAWNLVPDPLVPDLPTNISVDFRREKTDFRTWPRPRVVMNGNGLQREWRSRISTVLVGPQKSFTYQNLQDLMRKTDRLVTQGRGQVTGGGWSTGGIRWHRGSAQLVATLHHQIEFTTARAQPLV